MKLILSTIICAAAISSAAHGAEQPASNFFLKPYIGAEYQNTNINYQSPFDDALDSNLHGANVHLGARVHKNLGFELGYTQTETGEKNLPGGKTEVKVKGLSFDALGYVPVSSDGKLELIGTVGVTRNKAELETSLGSADETETKLRIGGGAEYWLGEHTNIRALVRYQGANFDDVANNAVITNVGLNYQF